VLSKSAHVAKAYECANAIVDSYLKGEKEFEEIRIDSAKAGAIFSIISREETVSDAAHQSFTNFLRRVDADRNRQILAEIQRVTKEDLRRVLEKWIKPLFDPKDTNQVVTTPLGKLDEVSQQFQKLRANPLQVEKNLDQINL
jgi:Zn-dependent M16 (insulinase) family peptidase